MENEISRLFDRVQSIHPGKFPDRGPFDEMAAKVSAEWAFDDVTAFAEAIGYVVGRQEDPDYGRATTGNVIRAVQGAKNLCMAYLERMVEVGAHTPDTMQDLDDVRRLHERCKGLSRDSRRLLELWVQNLEYSLSAADMITTVNAVLDKGQHFEALAESIQSWNQGQ